jgi:arsenate reductase
MHKTITLTDEISILHNPACSKAKKAYAYAQSISRSVSFYEFGQAATTPTQWRQLLEKLGKSPKEILDKSLPYYQANIRGREFEEEDWLQVLINNPSLIRSPIVTRGDKAILLDNPTDIYKI